MRTYYQMQYGYIERSYTLLIVIVYSEHNVLRFRKG